MNTQPPYLIYLGDARDAFAAKTGQGIVDWRSHWAIGQLRLPRCNADLHIPDMSIKQGVEASARTLLIGTVSPGGELPSAWSDIIVSALESGMDVASGLHTRLEALPGVKAAARHFGRKLVNIRHTDRVFKTGNGRSRSGQRLLTVGTDCSVGKMYTALCMERELRALGIAADFRATGQTGIFISGQGVAVDAVPADFISGAAEWLTPDAPDDHWDIVEGQGSLFHPSYAGVSLGLLHGVQPDAFIVCHEATRKRMRNLDFPTPSLAEVIEMTIRAGRVTNPAIRCTGVAINTQYLGDKEAWNAIKEEEDRLSLPVTDPMRFGVRPIADWLLKSS